METLMLAGFVVVWLVCCFVAGRALGEVAVVAWRQLTGTDND